jgi:tripartite-type tricarboxylate transporter receptor subunit TctC
MPAEPAIPTVAESGVPGYEVTNWHGLIGPKGLPRPVVERINGEINRMTKLQEMSERLRSQGVAPVGGRPEQLHDLIRRELDQWRKVIVAAGVKIH